MTTLNIDEIAASRDVPHDKQVEKATRLIRERAEREAPWRRDFTVWTWPEITDAAYLEAVVKFVKAQPADSKWKITVWLERRPSYGPQIAFTYQGDNHTGEGTITFTIAYRCGLSRQEVKAAAAKFVEAHLSDGRCCFTPLAHGQMQCPKVDFEYLAN